MNALTPAHTQPMACIISLDPKCSPNPSFLLPLYLSTTDIKRTILRHTCSLHSSVDASRGNNKPDRNGHTQTMASHRKPRQTSWSDMHCPLSSILAEGIVGGVMHLHSAGHLLVEIIFPFLHFKDTISGLLFSSFILLLHSCCQLHTTSHALPMLAVEERLRGRWRLFFLMASSWRSSCFLLRRRSTRAAATSEATRSLSSKSEANTSGKKGKRFVMTGSLPLMSWGLLEGWKSLVLNFMGRKYQYF